MPDTLDAKSSSPAPAPRGLGSLLFLLLLWLLLPAALANVLRAALHLPLWVGALTGILAVVGVTWKVATSRPLRPTHPPLAVLQVLYVAVTLGLTWRMLGIPVLGGLVTVGGGDAGNHAALRIDFATHGPDLYQGFTFFHTVAYGMEGLFGLDAFGSFRAAFYLIPAVLALALAAGLESVVGRLWRSARALVAAQVMLLVATAVVWPVLLLRLLHYHQADGFYAHLFGLVPLVLAWLAYGLPRSVWGRCAALAVFTVFYRYTYGLNLGDLLFTCGVLILVEGARSLPPKYRRWSWPVGLMLLGAAAYAYWRLLPLAHIPGGFVAYDYVSALWVQCLTVVGLLAVRFLSPRGEDVERRLLDFAMLFGGINALVQLAYLAARLPIDYYFLKYGFHAVGLLLCTVLLVVSSRLGALFQAERPRAWRWELALVVLFTLGLAGVTHGWSRAFKAYQASYRERVRGKPPFHRIEALEDRGATALIREVLRERDKRFGGLLSPSWPRLNFSNVALGWVPEGWQATNGHWPLFSDGTVREGPGTCVFWEASAADWKGYQRISSQGSPALEARVQKLHAQPDKVCRDYPAPWVPERSRTLCYRCD